MLSTSRSWCTTSAMIFRSELVYCWRHIFKSPTRQVPWVTKQASCPILALYMIVYGLYKTKASQIYLLRQNIISPIITCVNGRRRRVLQIKYIKEPWWIRYREHATWYQLTGDKYSIQRGGVRTTYLFVRYLQKCRKTLLILYFLRVTILCQRHVSNARLPLNLLWKSSALGTYYWQPCT